MPDLITKLLNHFMTNNNQSFFKRTSVRISIGVLTAVLLSLFLRGGETTPELTIENSTLPRTVSMYTISQDNGTAVQTADGSAFIVRAQSGGRVDRVAKVGDKVLAGAIVAQLENSAQRASYIQAEGAYDAAVAASGGNTSSQASAKQDAVRTWNSETVSSEQIIYTSIDTYFSPSSGGSISGFRELDSFGSATTFNERRVAIGTILGEWDLKATQVNEGNVTAMLGSLASDLSVIGAFIDDLASLVPRQRISEKYSEDDRNADTARLASARASITESQRKVDNATAAITNSSGSNAAMSSAQIKQALGVLESARAAINKTVIKTPVAGTITAASISVGDIINVGNDVVFVASDTAIKSDISIKVPLTSVKFTPTKAFVFTVSEGVLVAHEVETGLVTSNSIEISGAQSITQIVSDVRGLKDGDAVLTK
jgi:multidrug efflux pump subunit AcrA (membrane-fusion protein)